MRARTVILVYNYLFLICEDKRGAFSWTIRARAHIHTYGRMCESRWALDMHGIKMDHHMRIGNKSYLMF